MESLSHENAEKIDERHVFVDENAFFFDKSLKKFCWFQTNHYICTRKHIQEYIS